MFNHYEDSEEDLVTDEIYQVGAPESDYLYIAPSHIPGAGNGLHTAVDIYKGEIVSVFKGEVLTDRQIEIRLAKNQDRYFIEMLDGKILDSGRTKCFAKYANDARAYPGGVFRNNARITLDDRDGICLLASRNIKAGEEIFCGYGKRYWKKHA
ncbi:MAG: SET domain-containing protein-lysine N-methyltransferase [Chitinophagaceae bacterium]|nr:SET domain-containing protein-lysine N-methyltransferase [Chitinophagaceae bacterium]